MAFGRMGARGGFGSLGVLGGARIPQFPLFKAAVALQKAGTRDVKMMLVGDSTTMGQGGSLNASDFNGQIGAYPTQLAGLLTNASVQSRVGNSSSSSGYDGRLALGSGWSTIGNVILGSQFFYAASTTVGALAFTPTVQTNSLDIYYVQLGGAGSFSVNVNGGAAIGTTNTNGTSNLIKVTYTAPKGANTWNIVATTVGGIYIGAIVAHDTTGPKVIDVLNAGWSGGTITNLTSDQSAPYNAVPSFSVYQPDLTIICLTINDTNAATNLTTFSNNTQTVITAAKASGDVMLMSGVQSDPGSFPLPTPYRAVYDTLAASNGIYHLDLVTNLGNYAAMVAAGRMADTVHPNGVQASDGKGGYGAIAALVKITLASAL